MEPVLDVIGIGLDGPAGLRADLRERIHTADFLAGGERHLAYFPEARGERFVLRDNLEDLACALRDRLPEQRCVVLASGDPLFYGIGKFLLSRFSQVRIEPALSSMQLAFARWGVVPWQEAALASVHGRNLRSTLLPLLGRRTLGLFTTDGDGPAAVARFLLHFLDQEHGRPEECRYHAFVGENLGGPGECCTHWESLRDLEKQRFGSLNYLILHREQRPDHAEVERRRALVPGVPDVEFGRPVDAPEVMTRQEVRCVTLSKLLVPTEPGDVAWDLGAGLGTVAVELAVLRPGLEVVAVERDSDRAQWLWYNRQRFDALNVRLIQGTAPEALAGEPLRPRLVFLGGSGGRLTSVLDLVCQRLLPEGRLVANLVTLEHLAQTLERLRSEGWPVEVAELHVSRSDALAGLTGLRPQRGVFVVQANRP